MTTMIIFHANCMDGLGALWAVLHAHDAVQNPEASGFELHAGYHGDPAPDVDGKNVIIVDFSYSREVMEDLSARARSLLCLDHHISAKEALAGLPGCVFDMEQSGAGLAWRHFHPGQDVPAALAYIEDRDIWRKALVNTEEASAYIGYRVNLRSPVQEQLDTLTELCARPVLSLVGNGAPIRQTNLQHIESAAKSWFYLTLKDGTRVPTILGTVMVTSEAGHMMCSVDPGLHTSLVITSGFGGKFGLSFRSDDGGALRLAKLYGGGGHLNAAGASISAADIGSLLATREERP